MTHTRRSPKPHSDGSKFNHPEVFLPVPIFVALQIELFFISICYFIVGT
jgi:hypothetical protein